MRHKRGDTQQTIRWSALGLCGALAMAASLAFAETGKPINFNIQAQPIADALNIFAKQADIQLLFPFKQAGEFKANSLQGQYNTEEALSLLLQDTGFQYQIASDGSIVVRKQESSAESATGGSLKDTKAQSEEIEEVVITGSNIRGIKDGASPVQVIERAEIEKSGYGTAFQLIDSLPANFGGGINEETRIAGHGGGNSGFNRGGASSANLRGLGSSSTLVILNGRRLPAASEGVSVDVSTIPLSAIERVEVLKDGASSIYGSDAIAGVINFVTRKDYEGAVTSVRMGTTTTGERSEYRVSQLVGHSWDSGGAMISYEFNRRHPLETKYRDFINTLDPFFVLPDSTAHSAYLSANQKVTGNIEFFADVLYSARKNTDVLTRDVSGTHVVFQTDSDNEATVASAGFAVELGNSWHADIFGTYSETGTDYLSGNNVFPGPPFYTEYRGDSYSVEVRADGDLFAISGGAVKMALGGAYREETFGEVNIYNLARDVSAVYAETHIPFVGTDNQLPGIERLDLTLAGRYEKYSDFGSTFNPKIGLVWSPREGLIIRGTYSEAFRAPSQFELNEGEQFNFLTSQIDPFSPTGTRVVIRRFGGNPNLTEETADSVTFGLTLEPSSIPSLRIEVGYYDVEYKDRIQSPGGFDNMLTDPVLYAPFINNNPTDEQITELINTPLFRNFFGPFTFDDIESILDQRRQNISVVKVSGFDFSGRYQWDTELGTLDLSVEGTYMLKLDETLTATSPVAERVNTAYYPMDLRIRSSLGWSYNDMTATAFVNYMDSYNNDLNPLNPTSVSSWTTIDLQLGYQLPWNTSASLNVLNVFDQDPPKLVNLDVQSEFEYDSENANSLGRFVALQVTKSW